MVTSLEILDTAIKIGLGAFISGIAAYVIAKLNHKKDIEKSRLTRRMDLLEGVAGYVQKLTQAAISFYASSYTRAKYFARDKQIPDHQQTKWKGTDAKLNDTLSDATNAEAMLLLLGEEECQILLRKYGDHVSEFSYNAFYPEKYSVSEIEEFKVKLLEMRKAFFDKLSNAYRQ